MTTGRSASDTIRRQVEEWPGVEMDAEELGELAFSVAGREIGHLHGDGAAHFSFPKRVWTELHDEGRIQPHPVFPDATQGPAAREIHTDDDVRDVVALLRLNYDRVVARSGGRPPRSE